MVLRPAAEPLQAPGRAAPRGDGAWGDPHPDGGCTRGPLPPQKKNKSPILCSLPTPQFSMQMDLIRQQLEFEAQHIRALMEERFGTADEMVQRAQVGARPPHTSWPAPGGLHFTLPPTLPTPPCPPQIPASPGVPSAVHECTGPMRPGPEPQAPALYVLIPSPMPPTFAPLPPAPGSRPAPCLPLGVPGGLRGGPSPP